MKAIAVYPGKPNSVHLCDVPDPNVKDIAGGRGVLVKVLRVGVDGTDKEINAAEYGAAPPGDDYLIALAEASRAAIVSGDGHLLGLRDELPVYSPAELLALLEEP